MDLRVGDQVHLLRGRTIVGEGSIFRSMPSDFCHTKTLGPDNYAVSVSVCLEDVELPFPIFDMHNLQSVVGTFVMWNKEEVLLKAERFRPQVIPMTSPVRPVDRSPLPSPLNVRSEENTPSTASFTESSVPGDEDRGSTRIKDVAYYASRKRWMLEPVFMMHPSTSELVLGEGTINFNMPHQYVNGVLLGEERVGVVFDDLKCKDDPDLVKRFFPGFRENQPAVICWDIENLVIPMLGKRLSEMYNDLGNGDPLRLHLGSDKRKRRDYRFLKRKATSEEEKLSTFQAKKRHMHVQESVMNNVSALACCENECCRKASRSGLADERSQYWGMETDQRASFIFEKFRYRSPCLVKKGQMLFDGQIVCKTAFYQLYGFGRTLFYDYQKRYKLGAKVGYHMGTGLRKPTSKLCSAVAHLKIILESNSEPMPHLSYSGTCGTSGIQFKLPACYSKEYVFEELNASLRAAMLEEISLSSFYKAWRENYANFSIYQQGAFAKCSVCSLLRDRLANERRTEARDIIFGERLAHIALANSRKTQYYTNRALAQMSPQKYLSIIHDKMDQAKTGLPRMWESNKDFQNNCAPLPLALTGMLVHGREPHAFGHFSVTGLWPSDPNFTITSLAKLFSDLENWRGDYSGDLAKTGDDAQKHPLLHALMDATAFKTGYLPHVNKSLDDFANKEASTPVRFPLGSFTPLPRHLLLQLDNSGKDNKNKHVLGFCGELVAKGVFETIQVSFLMVGHTHEDIDALFSQLSRALRQQEVSSFHQLMSMFWGCECHHPVPYLIQEVADYKSYSKGFFNKMVGHSAPIAFRFSMRNNVPIYQCKEHLTSPWLPLAGRPVFKTDAESGRPTLPQWRPKAVPIASMLRKRNEIINLIERFIAAKVKGATDTTSAAFANLAPLKSYWENILEVLKTGFGTELTGTTRGSSTAAPSHSCGGGEHSELLGDFWPRTNHNTGYRHHETQEDHNLHPLELEQEEALAEANQIFVGDPKDRLFANWTPLGDITPDHMVIVRPNDAFGVSNAVWLCRSLSIVDMKEGSPNLGEFKAEWWRPVYNKGSRVLDSVRYKNSLAPHREWEKEPDQDVTHIFASAAIYGWNPKDGAKQKGTVKIPQKVISIVREFLNQVESEDEGGEPF